MKLGERENDPRPINGIDPVEAEANGLYDMPNTRMRLEAFGAGHWQAEIQEHDAHVIPQVYHFSDIEKLIVWLRSYATSLAENAL